MDTQRSPHTKVFIQRDFSEGIPVKFQTRYPPELEGRVGKTFMLFLNLFGLKGLVQCCRLEMSGFK